MQIGTVVRYRKKYPDGMKIDWIGIVIDISIDHPNKHIHWNNGMRQWRHPSVLEVVCE